MPWVPEQYRAADPGVSTALPSRDRPRDFDLFTAQVFFYCYRYQ